MGPGHGLTDRRRAGSDRGSYRRKSPGTPRMQAIPAAPQHLWPAMIMSTLSRSSIPLGAPRRRHGTSRVISLPPPAVAYRWNPCTLPEASLATISCIPGNRPSNTPSRFMWNPRSVWRPAGRRPHHLTELSQLLIVEFLLRHDLGRDAAVVGALHRLTQVAELAPDHVEAGHVDDDIAADRDGPQRLSEYHGVLPQLEPPLAAAHHRDPPAVGMTRSGEVGDQLAEIAPRHRSGHRRPRQTPSSSGMPAPRYRPR